MKKRKLTLDKYYDSLKRVGMHKFFVEQWGGYQKPFWIILVVIIFVVIVLDERFYKILSFREKMLVFIGLLGVFKLGTIFGHKEGFINGYHKGVDDYSESTFKKKALAKIQEEELKKVKGFQ